MKKILKDRRGETMVELMVAFVLIVLALATLSVLVSVGLKMNRLAADADRKYHSDFSAAGGEQVTMTISGGPMEFNYPLVYDAQVNEDGMLYFG